jgi:hypothetical protein
MKTYRIHTPVILVSLMTVLFLGSCQDKYLQTYEINNPIYMSYADLRTAVADTTPEEINYPGKIYFLGDYIFVNEVREGIHVIDNSNPSNPQIISFIKIPGNIDMAIKNNILYADSYVDLVAIDISDLDNIKELARFEDIFNYDIPPYEAGTRVGEVNQTMGVVVGWNREKVTEEIDRFPTSGMWPERMWGGAMMFDASSARPASKVSGGDGGTGTGGSMARFIIYRNILYTIDQSNLYMFDISDELSPFSVGNESIGWNIETVFVARDHLFIGSMQGMYIYDLRDPVDPEYVSSYWHVTSCDPVVVEGNYAYITLRTGNRCETDVNQLDIVDIHKLDSPKKIKSYPMYNPHGLGIDNGTLFVCDGDEGLKIYDARDPLNLKANKIAHFEDINTFDVIPVNDLLIMIGNDGLYQYDYSNRDQITLLSMIPIVYQQ